MYPDDDARPTELLPLIEPPPAPRMGGRGPAIIGVALLIGSLLAFVVVLVLLNVIPSPLGERAPVPAVVIVTPSSAPSPARFAQKDACVRNQGTDEDPDLVLADCVPGALEIIERFDSTSDTKLCVKVPGYKYHYYYDSELAGLDFVLCMRDRP